MPTRPRHPLITALALLLLGSACAEERDAINRVQPHALDKTFFVGPKLSDPSDNPEFYYRPTVVDVDYGAGQDGMFTASYAQSMARVGWEITEDLLVARLTYERILDSSGKGAPDDDSGQIVAAFRIESHFDIRRAYNPQTGEELNIVEENSQDRPWYERGFMRVDFSENLVTTAYELDTLAQLKAYSDNAIEYESATYSVEDPNDEDAAVFDPASGYFDVTNKVFAKPQLIDTPWGTYPACFLTPDLFGGTGPISNCNPVELKVRLSFKKLTDTDYEPIDWDGQRQQMFGAFTTGTLGPTRFGYDRRYGVVDSKWHRFVNRHNIWQQSHQRDENGLVKCERDDTCPLAAEGARCDVHVGACTIPYRQRAIRPIVYYYGPDSDPTLFQAALEVADDWDSALRHAVQTGRYAECVREHGGVTSQEAIDTCKAEYPPTLEGAMEQVERILYMCHNPVIEEDPDACGEVGRLARVGDLRYHIANIVQSPQMPSPWGIMADATDPVTGEVVASSVNVWNHVTDLQVQKVIDLARWYLGELTSEDVTTGRYVKDVNVALAPGQRPALRGPSLLSNEEIDRRIAAMDRSLVDTSVEAQPPPVGARQVVDWASAFTRELYGDSVLGRGNTPIQSRLLGVRGSAVETELLTGPFLTMAGLDRSVSLDETALRVASPLRAAFWQNRAVLERERQLRLAQSGRCVLEAGQPSNVAELGAALVRKFPVGEASPGSTTVTLTAEELEARNQKWAEYLRKRITRGVLAHEMGHSMGLRHVFTSSFDALNYRPQYWQLRTRDKQETTYCEQPTDDGESCIGPRWKDPITDRERDGMLMMWQQTSVMDYPGDMSQELLDIGPYDRAAIRFIYTDITDIWDEPGNTRRAAVLADRLDNFGGIIGPIYGWLGSRPEGARHYSQFDREFDLIRDCQPVSTDPPEDWDEETNGVYDPVLDGFIVNGTRCSGPPTDYVAYRDLVAVEDNGELIRKYDAKGRVRRPYLFASDEYADIGNIAVYRSDNGADAYEVASFFINEYEDMHVFENHRRGRTTFSLSNAFIRSYSRYGAKLKEMSKAFAFLNEIFTATNGIDFYTNQPFSDGISRPHALATSLTFDHFTRMLTRPHSGEHFLAQSDGVLRSADQAYVAAGSAANTPIGGRATRVVVPEGTINPGTAPSLGGRPLHNALDQSKGYYATDYDLWVGSYYDKTLALDLLVDSTDRFISQSRDDFHDGRYRNVSFATLYPEAVRRLVANTLTDDAELTGWRVPARANGQPLVQSGTFTPLQPLGFPVWWPEDGPSTCWPAFGSLSCTEPVTGETPEASLPLDPEIGFEVQKFIVFFSLLYLPESWKRDWVDLMRIYRLGADPEPSFAPDERVVFTDPVSGETYVARSHGTETIFGRTVQRGIGARMLEWANVLTERAYVVDSTDPVTGEVTVARYADDSECPTGTTRCTGDPVLKSQSAKLHVTRLRGYVSLIDFVRTTTAQFGYYGPGWRGVF